MNKLTKPLTEKSETYRRLIKRLNQSAEQLGEAREGVTETYQEVSDGLEEMCKRIMSDMNSTRTKIFKLRAKLLELDYDENHKTPLHNHE